jgi:hypothetical protein
MRIIVVALGESRLIIVFMRFSMVGRAPRSAKMAAAAVIPARILLERAECVVRSPRAKCRGKFKPPALDAARARVVQSSG